MKKHHTMVHFCSEMNSTLLCYSLPPFTIVDQNICQPRIFCFLLIALTLPLNLPLAIPPTHTYSFYHHVSSLAVPHMLPQSRG